MSVGTLTHCACATLPKSSNPSDAATTYPITMVTKSESARMKPLA
jgi:hypothetical protein